MVGNRALLHSIVHGQILLCCGRLEPGSAPAGRCRRPESVYPSAVSHAFAFHPSQGYGIRDSLVRGAGYWLKFPAGGERLGRGPCRKRTPSHCMPDGTSSVHSPLQSMWILSGLDPKGASISIHRL